MNQSAVIGGAILAAFALFVTARGKLNVYGRVLWGDKPDAHAVDVNAVNAGTNTAVDAVSALTGGLVQLPKIPAIQ